MTNKTKKALIVVLFFIILFLSYSYQKGEKITEENTQITETAKEELVIYEILNQSQYAPNGEKFFIMLPEDSSREYVQKVTREMLNEYKGSANELTWFFWDDQRIYNIDTGFNVGTAKWKDGNLTFKWKESVSIESTALSTDKELEIFDYYWEVFDESGNPRGYTTHPTVVDEYTNDWELERIKTVIEKYDITSDELFEIVMKLAY